MKRSIIFLAITILSGCSLYAQIPGYMGKRFTLSYNAHMAPNINAVLSENSNSTVRIPLRLNTKHIIEADYVIGRRVTAGFELGFMRHNVPYKYQKKNDLDPNTFNTITTLADYDLNGYSIGFNFKFYGPFNKNTLAPLGSYLVLQGSRLSYNAFDKIGGTAFEYGGAPSKASLSGSSLGIGFGTKRIYYDKLTLDFAMSTNLALVLPDDSSNKKTGEHAAVRVASQHFLMYKIGIGGLLF